MEEFLRRYCPWGIGKVRCEMRLGRREELIVAVAEEVRADIVALGWAQELEAGRAPLVRTVLTRGAVPLLLVPVHVLEGSELVSSAPAGPVSM